MATPAAVLSVLVNTDSASATAKLTEYNAKLEKTAEMARKPIEARLGATFDPAGFDAYQAKVAQIERKNADRKAFRAELGANYSPAGFNAYQRAVTKAQATSDETSKKVGRLSSVLSSAGSSAATAGKRVAEGVLVGATAAVYASAKFQSATTKLGTQAGASNTQINKLRLGMLNMAQSVGQTPDALTAGMYHVVSSMNAVLPPAQRAADELKVLKGAAQLADVGGSNLEETSYALASAMNSLHVPVSQTGKVIGQLNAIVGSGDMTMTDLIDALKSGVLPAARTAGLSLQSLGAAFAVMGDQGMKGAMAGTRLRMSIALLTSPAKQAAGILDTLGLNAQEATSRSSAMAKALAAAGLTTTQLGADLKKPNGFVVALQDLKDHLIASGVTATGTAAIMGKAFGGGRMGATINLLANSTGRLTAKFAQSGMIAGNFQKDFSKTTQTLTFQLKQLEGAVTSIAVKFGNVLLPIVTKVTTGISNFISWLQKGSAAAHAVEVAIAAIGGALVLAFGAAVLAPIIAAGATVLAIGAAIGAAAFLIVKNWTAVKTFFLGLYHSLSAPIGGFVSALTAGWNQIKTSAVNAWHTIMNAFSSGKGTGAAINGMKVLKTALGDVIKALTVFVTLWAKQISVFIHLWAGAVVAIKDIIGAIVNVVKGGLQVIKGTIEFFAGLFTLNFSKMWDGIKKIFSGGLKALLGILSGAWHAFLAVGQSIGDAIGSGLKTAFDAVVNWIVDKLNWVIKKANDVISALDDIPGVSIGKIGLLPHIGNSGKAASASAILASEGAGKRLNTHGNRLGAFPGTNAHASRTHTRDHVSRVRTISAPTARVRRRAIAVSAPVSGAAQHVQSVSAADKAINAADSKILKLERARENATTKAQKTGLDHELAVERLRRSGLELQRTQLSESASAQTKQQASDKTAAAARQQAAQNALSKWLAYWSHVPSQAAGQQIRLAKLQNRLTVAQNDSNTSGQSKALHGEEKLYKQWLQLDEAKLRKLNQQLGRPNLSGKQHRALVNDKLALLQEIGTIQGDIGQTSSSLQSLVGSSTATDSTGGTGAFDLAPTGASIPFPTAVDARSALRGGRARQEVHHHTHHTNHNQITIKVEKNGDIHKVADVIDKHTGSHLHAKIRAAGMRGI